MPASEQGITHDRYQLIPRTLIFVQNRDKILLIKGAPDKRLWANKFNGLGGHIERGEDVLAAAHRELLEETGVKADLRLVGTVLVDAGQSVGVGIFVYFGMLTSGVLRSSAEGELHWVAVDEIHSLPLVEDVGILLKKILSMQADSPPFSARSFYQDDGLQVKFSPL